MRTGLAIMRLQPLHRGHCLIINTMLSACEKSIVAIGSVNSNDKIRNPFSFDERKAMLENHFSQACKMQQLVFLALEDDTSLSYTAWTNYVKAVIAKHNLPKVTHYYCGSKIDAIYYQNSGWCITILDRYSMGKGLNATAIREKS